MLIQLLLGELLDTPTVTGITCRMNKHVSLAPVPNAPPHLRGAVNVVDSATNRILFRGLSQYEGKRMELWLNNKPEEMYVEWFKGYTKAYDESYLAADAPPSR